MTIDSADHVQQALDSLDAMSECWAEKVGLSAMVDSIPLGLPSAEFQQRARDSIATLIKLAYVEGMYQAISSAGGHGSHAYHDAMLAERVRFHAIAQAARGERV